MISDIEQCDGTPDYVIEVAGQAAVKEHAQKVLAKGWTIGLISVGTLADSEFLVQLKQTAEKMMPICIYWQGLSPVLTVFLRPKKVVCKSHLQRLQSPKSWKGSYAEQLVDLDHVSEPTVFYWNCP